MPLGDDSLPVGDVTPLTEDSGEYPPVEFVGLNNGNSRLAALRRALAISVLSVLLATNEHMEHPVVGGEDGALENPEPVDRHPTSSSSSSTSIQRIVAGIEGFFRGVDTEDDIIQSVQETAEVHGGVTIFDATRVPKTINGESYFDPYDTQASVDLLRQISGDKTESTGLVYKTEGSVNSDPEEDVYAAIGMAEDIDKAVDLTLQMIKSINNMGLDTSSIDGLDREAIFGQLAGATSDQYPLGRFLVGFSFQQDADGKYFWLEGASYIDKDYEITDLKPPRSPLCDAGLNEVLKIDTDRAFEGYKQIEFAIDQTKIAGIIEELKISDDPLSVANEAIEDLGFSVAIPTLESNPDEFSDGYSTELDQDQYVDKLSELLRSLSSLPKGYVVAPRLRQIMLFGELRSKGSRPDDSVVEDGDVLAGNFGYGIVKLSEANMETVIHEVAHAIDSAMCGYAIPALDPFELPGDTYDPKQHISRYAAVNHIENTAEIITSLLLGEFSDKTTVSKQQKLIYDIIKDIPGLAELVAFNSKFPGATWEAETPLEFIARGTPEEDGSIYHDADSLTFNSEITGSRIVEMTDGTPMRAFDLDDGGQLFIFRPPKGMLEMDDNREIIGGEGLAYHRMASQLGLEDLQGVTRMFIYLKDREDVDILFIIPPK
jgi:hypothetical protein